MFGKMNTVPILDLYQGREPTDASLDTAIVRLLEVTEHQAIAKWVQFPKALFVFLIVPGDPESGAFYLYDRRARVWYWVDFDDEKFGGYSVSDFDRLVRECRFLDLAEQPRLLKGKDPWIVTPGSRPHQYRDATSTSAADSAPKLVLDHVAVMWPPAGRITPD